MTAPSEAGSADQVSTTTATAPVPKRITNAQTVCNEKNAKGKLCNGHLKQLRTAGEPAEIHLRGDDVLFKCQTCGTFYMGPPLGHVRDPEKQSRFVEAELTALLQAAGGTMPIIKKDARGVFVLEASGGHAPAAAKPAAAPPSSAAQGSAAPPQSPVAAKPNAAPAQKSATPKAGAEPDRKLMKRSTYSGVVDTGPVAGETFEQKVARLKAVAAGAKQRAEEGGGEVAPVTADSSEGTPSSTTPEAPPTQPPPTTPPVTASEASEVSPVTEAGPSPSPPPSATKPTGQADRTLMNRSTYCGIVDTGPVAGETFEQKVERLRALAAAAKQRADGG